MSEPTRYTQVDGGCWVACLAGLTGIPHEVLSALVPTDMMTRIHADEDAFNQFYDEYRSAVLETIQAHGWGFSYVGAEIPRGFALGSGLSPRGYSHAVIVKDGEVWHDPHPSRAGVLHFTGFSVVFPIVGLLQKKAA